MRTIHQSILFILLSTYIFQYSYAQNPTELGMHIEHNTTWDSILKKARKENKFIFVDAYTSWCGPCKWMLREVFPQKEVGDSVNPYYISLAIDMEKPEGIYFAKKFNIHSYPTFLFFDKEGTYVHRYEGPMQPKEFIDLCLQTLKPENQYITLRSQYLEGNRDSAFLRIFTERAIDNKDSLAQQAIKDFMKSVLYELNKPNVELLEYSIENVHDTCFSIMLANKEVFSKYLGNEFIENQLEYWVKKEAYKNGKNGEDTVAFRKTIERYLPEKSGLLCDEYTVNMLAVHKNWSAYLPKATQFAKEYCWNDRLRLTFIAMNMLFKYRSKSVWQEGLSYALRSIELNSYFDNNEIAARLYAKLGDKTNAIKYATKAIALSKESEVDYKDMEEFLKSLK